MRIHLQRSGGFAGLQVSYELDSANLSPEAANELARLVDASHFFELPPVLRATRPGADRFQYDLSITTESREHKVQVDEAALPDSLRPLLNWIMAAKRRAPSSRTAS